MGLEISIGWLTLLMFGSLLVLLMAGLPLAFVTGGLACVFLFVLGDSQSLNMVPSRIFPLMTDYQLSVQNPNPTAEIQILVNMYRIPKDPWEAKSNNDT